MKRLIICVAALILLAGCSNEEKQAPSTATTKTSEQPAAAQPVKYVTIGTGGVTGVYYPTGGAISQIVNAKRKQYNLRVTVESTGGSVYNVNAVMAGDLDFGVVQSDRQFQAYHGTADWAGKPQKKLRSVFSIHPETLTLVAAVDANINSVADLKGKRVNIGNPGSGQHGNALDLLEAEGLKPQDLTLETYKVVASEAMLEAGLLDAFFYTVGHPNGLIKQAVTGPRKVKFVPIEPAVVEKLVSTFPYYAPSLIPVRFYPGVANQEPVPSFGVLATLVTSADVADAIVYAVTKEVFEHIEEFKKLHPAFSTLTREGMLQGLSAPIHPGAMKYYKEAGLKK